MAPRLARYVRAKRPWQSRAALAFSASLNAPRPWRDLAIVAGSDLWDALIVGWRSISGGRVVLRVFGSRDQAIAPGRPGTNGAAFAVVERGTESGLVLGKVALRRCGCRQSDAP